MIIVHRRIRNGQNSYTDEMKPCNDRKKSLWKMGAPFPPPGKHVLRFPFSFPPPADSPPSMQEDGQHMASITYKLDLCGERSVTFGFNIRIERWVQVIPPRIPNMANIGGLRFPSGRDLVRIEGMDISRSFFSH